MPFTTKWMLQNRITYSKIIGELPMEESLEISNQILEISKQMPVSPPVLLHLIIDMLDQTSQPSLQEFIKSRGQMKIPPNAGWIVFVNKPNTLIRFVTNVAAQFFNVRFRFADTLPDALILLQQLDKTLPDLSGLANPEVKAGASIP